MVLSCWAKGYHEPQYLVSNMATAEEACRLYEKRFRIETFLQTRRVEGSIFIECICRCTAPVTVINRRVFSLYMDCLTEIGM